MFNGFLQMKFLAYLFSKNCRTYKKKRPTIRSLFNAYQNHLDAYNAYLKHRMSKRRSILGGLRLSNYLMELEEISNNIPIRAENRITIVDIFYLL